MTEIIPGVLYLGSRKQALDSTWLDENNIGAILNCAQELSLPEPSLRHRAYCHLDLDDFNHNELFTTEFTRAYNFLERCRELDLKVLVHCYAGINRSVTTTICYLARKESYTYYQASRTVLKKHPQGNPWLFYKLIRNAVLADGKNHGSSS